LVGQPDERVLVFVKDRRQAFVDASLDRVETCDRSANDHQAFVVVHLRAAANVFVSHPHERSSLFGHAGGVPLYSGAQGGSFQLSKRPTVRDDGFFCISAKG